MSRRRLKISPDFARVAKKLDPHTLTRVRKYLETLATLENPRDRGKALSANLNGYWRYRVGDYRLIVEIRPDTLIAVGLGHRSEIYRRK